MAHGICPLKIIMLTDGARTNKTEKLKDRFTSRKAYNLMLRAPAEMLHELMALRVRAMRKGLWFKLLTPVERSICELAIRSLRAVRSRRLARVLRAIMDKLVGYLKRSLQALARAWAIGSEMARIISLMASSWGHPRALEWARNPEFVTYLTITYANTPSYYRPQLSISWAT